MQFHYCYFHGLYHRLHLVIVVTHLDGKLQTKLDIKKDKKVREILIINHYYHYYYYLLDTFSYVLMEVDKVAKTRNISLFTL